MADFLHYATSNFRANNQTHFGRSISHAENEPACDKKCLEKVKEAESFNFREFLALKMFQRRASASVILQVIPASGGIGPHTEILFWPFKVPVPDPKTSVRTVAPGRSLL